MGAAASAVLERGEVNGGIVTQQGGGIYAAGLLTVTDTDFDLNMAMFGGGIYLASTTASLTGASVANSVAADTGGT